MFVYKHIYEKPEMDNQNEEQREQNTIARKGSEEPVNKGENKRGMLALMMKEITKNKETINRKWMEWIRK